MESGQQDEFDGQIGFRVWKMEDGFWLPVGITSYFNSEWDCTHNYFGLNTEWKSLYDNDLSQPLCVFTELESKSECNIYEQLEWAQIDGLSITDHCGEVVNKINYYGFNIII